MPWPLVGRDGELALLDEEVAERSRSGCVVLAGPVGVGKSRLLAAWTARLEAAGRPVAVVRATRSTATIPFGAFAGWAPGRLAAAGDRLAILHAIAARLTGQEESPVLVVDDAHLVDEGSAALLLHLVEHTSLAVLLAVRRGEPCPDAVVALWKEGLARRVELGPLSEEETAELLGRALGGPVAAGARRRVWQLTGGNPLYLREIVAAARAQGVLVRTPGPASVDDAGRRPGSGVGSGGSRDNGSGGRDRGGVGEWRWRGRLSGGTRLVELVSDRIGGRDSAERRVLELVALGEPLPVDVLARLAPRRLVADLERQGLLDVDTPPGASGPVTRVAHPLYAEVLRAELPAFTARLHGAELAGAAMDVGMDEHDPVRVATWLLDAGDDPMHPELLLRASLRARVVEAFALSLRFAEAAERAGGGWPATLRRAIALGPLGRLVEADELLSALSRPESEPEARVEAAQVRAEQAFWYRGEDLSVARAIVDEATAQASPDVRSALPSYGAQLAVMGLDLDGAIRLATQAYNEAGSPAQRLEALTGAGLAAAFQGRAETALAICRLAQPDAVALMGENPLPALYVANAFSLGAPFAGRIDEAAAAFDAMLDQQVGGGEGAPPALLKYWAGRAALDQGRVGTAVRLCREALAYYGDQDHYDYGTWTATTLALAAAQAGDLATAARAVDWIDARTRPGVPCDERQTDVARAWLVAARGEVSAARETALVTARRAGETGAGLLETVALLTAARLGAAEAAAPRLEQLTEVVEGPYVVAAARFARAAARSDGIGLDDAAERFATLGARLLAAEAATAASEAHAREGQRRRHADARDRALELAAQCEGAVTPLLARLDQAPLVATLTDREREVAVQAARGRTSRQIARALGISVRTVHSHLYHLHTKLGTGDRAELAVALGLDLDPGPDPDDGDG